MDTAWDIQNCIPSTFLYCELVFISRVLYLVYANKSKQTRSRIQVLVKIKQLTVNIAKSDHTGHAIYNASGVLFKYNPMYVEKLNCKMASLIILQNVVQKTVNLITRLTHPLISRHHVLTCTIFRQG